GPRRGAPADDVEREAALLSALSVPGVARLSELARGPDGTFLVLDDRGAVPLPALLGSGPMEVATALHLGLQLASVLAELHREDVVHNGLQPAAVLVNPTSHEVSLIDLAGATRGAGPTQAAGRVALRQESLAYVSPEQTGRMSRVIDYRTDLYSAGLVLYEM